MSKSAQNLIGIILVLAVILAFGYAIIFLAKPDPAQVSQIQNKVDPVDPSILSTDLSSETSGLEVNGELPVKIPSSELGRENPFQEF